MASRLSKVYDMGMDMTANHYEYSYPITNITYHLPDSPHPERGEAVAQKAFQRILDGYDENERLADAFQVELDKRTQIANERKAEERRIRAERQRLAREERRNKKQSKSSNNKTTIASSIPTTTTATITPPPGGPTGTSSGLSVAALAQAFQPRHGRFAAAGYSLVGLEQRRPSIDHNNAVSSNGRSRQSSVGSLHSCSSSTNTANTSAHEGEAPMVDSRLSLSASDHPHSPPLLDVHGHNHSSSSHPADRSLSSSPTLPLTPSPRLTPSDTAFGVVGSLPSTLAVTTAAVSPTSSTMTAAPLPSASSASGLPNTSSNFPSTNNNNNNNNNTSLPTPPPQQHSGSSTLSMRNKRKQAIPVHPSVIKRIPGITFRIQPDLDKHLQVEILKNIEDYKSTATKDVSRGGGHSTSLSTNMNQQKQQQDDASQLQANQDLNKVRQSITSSRPGYASLYIPDDSASYDDPYLQDYRETSPNTVALHAAPNQNNTNTRYHPYQQHSRNGSLGSAHNVSIYTPTNLRSRSSSSANIWAPYAPSTAGLAMLLSDVVAARATLPLSWDNFSTRDCQVNKVVGKNGQDFEQLEAMVQETVARHQAVAAAAQQEADEENQEDDEGTDELAHKSEQKASTAAKESSGSSSDASRKRRSAPVTTPPPPAAASLSQASAQRATGSRATRSRTTHHTEGGRSSRAGATDLVEGYDDIERILKEKRQKKREQRKSRDSQSRGVSEATTEGGYDMDVEMEHPRIKEDDDMDDRSALLRGYTESEHEGSGRTLSKRGAAKPHTPPHSRQVTPAAKVDLGSSSLHHHAYLGSNLSRTPPATPTRASMRHPQHTDSSHQESSAESTSTPVSKTRARARSFSTTIPTDANTNFFESALEMIEAKRRQSIAKKKASAIVNSPTAAVATGTTSTDSQQDHHQQQVDEQQQQANQQLERELANETSQKMMAPNSNIPKSSKFLPGRVLRKSRVKNYGDSDIETDHHDGGSTSGSATSSIGGEVMYDRDCSSCRLDVTNVDRELWKQARRSGEIYVNPKTWGRTAILCSSCRTQYQCHGLRCTQCFYVPVWNPNPAPASAPAISEGSSSSASSVGSTSVMPKPGGTCKRCKAGTWFQEV